MDSKRILYSILLMVSLCVQGIAQHSPETVQENDTAGSAIDAYNQTAAANELVQPFSWESAGDVLKYEILIEQYDEKSRRFVDYVSHVTTEEETAQCLVYFDPILPPGRYRSTIIVYNILGIREDSLTAKDEFVVRTARKPEVRSVSYVLNMSSTIYLDDLDNNGIIEISGTNLLMPPASNTDIYYTEYRLVSGRRSIAPQEVLSHDERDRRIRLRFDMNKLERGEYHLIAQDASGLHSEESNGSALAVKFKKRIDFDLSLNYSLPVILHDKTFTQYMNRRVHPLSATLRMELLPFKERWGYLGFGITANYTRMKTKYDSYTIDGNLMSAHFNFVYQLPAFRRHVIFELHGGIGVAYFNHFVFHFAHNINTIRLNTVNLSFDAGISAQIYINKRLFVETTADYIIARNKDIQLGMLIPSVGMGWQF
ncbi:MAG: hypothetical protein IJR50_02055 [Treponema sp.]|nr:hypothetical protein [Treponema sp.]